MDKTVDKTKDIKVGQRWRWKTDGRPARRINRIDGAVVYLDNELWWTKQELLQYWEPVDAAE